MNVNPKLEENMKTRFLLLFTLLLIANIGLFAQTPDWVWATGGNCDSVDAIKIDNVGNTYVTGYFYETATFGSYSLTNSNLDDDNIFVAKMDCDGNWQWASQAGGTGQDRGYGISIDDTENIYVTGKFNETAHFGSYSLTSNGYSDMFIAKIDADGDWQWANNAGGSVWDEGRSITIDDAGNFYVTGNFSGTATFGSYSITGAADIFVAKMDVSGNWLWANNAGGSSFDEVREITIDDAENTYVTGLFRETATFGSHSITSNGPSDIFVAKMDAYGIWQWATQIDVNGYYEDGEIGITADNTGNIYVTGRFYNTATFGPYSITSNGDADAFITKLDSDGNWQWANNAGGSVWDEGRSITIDSAANTCVTGWFEGTASFGSYSLTSCGGLDIFVGKMEPDGNWQWVVKAGGGLYDEGHGINVDANGNSYVTGYFEGAATFGSITLTTGGDDNMFIAKLNSSVSVENEIIPMEIQFSNYPNPFNPTTKIQYSIKERSNIRIDVYNLKGHPVKSLFNGQQDAGDHSVVWNGKDDNANNVSSGIYFYKLNVNGETESVKKCILMK